MSVPPTVRLEGGCACGSVRYVLTAAPHDAGVCHCRTCQRVSGAPMLAFGSVPRSAFFLVRGAPRHWRSSEFGERTFCGVCGAQLTMRMDDQPETLDITLSTLDAPDAVRPGFQIWTDSQISWGRLEDELPRYPMSRPGTAGA